MEDYYLFIFVNGEGQTVRYRMSWAELDSLLGLLNKDGHAYVLKEDGSVDVLRIDAMRSRAPWYKHENNGAKAGAAWRVVGVSATPVVAT